MQNMLIFSYIKMYLNCFKSSVKVNPCPTSGASGAYSEIRLGGGAKPGYWALNMARRTYIITTRPHPELFCPPPPPRIQKCFGRDLSCLIIFLLFFFSSFKILGGRHLTPLPPPLNTPMYPSHISDPLGACTFNC